MKSSKTYDIWKTIGFSIASVGLMALGWFNPSVSKMSSAMAVGSGVGLFGNAMTIKYDGDSISKIKHYEGELHDFAKLVEDDIKATEKIMDFFH